MSDGEKFNTSGRNGRDCPICFRVGTLAGDRAGDAPRLTCTGCHTVFAFTWGDGATCRDTLTRLRVPEPPRRHHFELVSNGRLPR
jgi:hypothetical protein